MNEKLIKAAKLRPYRRLGVQKGCKVCSGLCCSLWLYALDLHILQPRGKLLVQEHTSVVTQWQF